MKLVKTFSAFGIVAFLATACGSGSTSTYSANNTAAPAVAGAEPGNTIGGTPITTSGTVTGYQATTVLLGGYQSVYGNTINFTSTSSLPAGSQVLVNMAGIQAEATMIVCAGFDTQATAPASISNINISVGGQALTLSGAAQTLSVGGQLTVTASLATTGNTCFIGGPGNGISYAVNFGSAISTTTCVDINGNPIACPAH